MLERKHILLITDIQIFQVEVFAKTLEEALEEAKIGFENGGIDGVPSAVISEIDRKTIFEEDSGSMVRRRVSEL